MNAQLNQANEYTESFFTVLNSVLAHVPQVASVLPSDVIQMLASLEVREPLNVRGGYGMARRLNWAICRGLGQIASFLADSISEIKEGINGSNGLTPQALEAIKDVTREEEEAHNIAWRQYKERQLMMDEQKSSSRVENAEVEDTLAKALFGLVNRSTRTLLGVSSHPPSAASSRPPSAASSRNPSAASSVASSVASTQSRKSKANSIAAALALALAARVATKENPETPILQSDIVDGLIEDCDEVVYSAVPTKEPDSQMSDVSMDSASSEELAPLLVDQEQLTAIVENFNAGPGTISGQITVADSNGQPVTSSLTMAVADTIYNETVNPESGQITRTQNTRDDSDLDGGRRKSKRRRNKRQTKKKRPIRRRQRRQTKRRQRRYTKRRVLRKRR